MSNLDDLYEILNSTSDLDVDMGVETISVLLPNTEIVFKFADTGALLYSVQTYFVDSQYSPNLSAFQNVIHRCITLWNERNIWEKEKYCYHSYGSFPRQLWELFNTALENTKISEDYSILILTDRVVVKYKNGTVIAESTFNDQCYSIFLYILGAIYYDVITH